MPRRLAITTLVCLVGLTVWILTRRAEPAATILPAASTSVHPRSESLATIRRSMDAARLEAFIAEQADRAQADQDAAEWRVLGEAHLERVLLESSRSGMAVGKPTFANMPQVVATHLDAGEQAISRARQRGDTHSEVARIEAGLKANRMTGVVAAMKLGREVEQLVDEANARDAGNPHVAVMKGCRLAFTPKWLGGNPARALPLFEQAAQRLTHDERPLVFAAFTAHLIGDDQAAKAHLQQATVRNPANRYAREVLRRLTAGEASPFERDLDPP